MQKTWKREVAWPFECSCLAWETWQGLQLDVWVGAWDDKDLGCQLRGLI